MRHFLVKAAHSIGVDTSLEGFKEAFPEAELVRIYTTHISLSMFLYLHHGRSRADSGSVSK